MDINILLNQNFLELGLKQFIVWSVEKAPHMVIIGNTGSGKSYFSKLLLGKIALHINHSQLYVCDFKSDEDFSFLDDCSRFYRYTDCSKGLQEFYDRFQKRQKKDELTKNPIFLFWDELASHFNTLDKKILEEEKKKLSNLLMLGRSFNVHVIVSQQRADATYFNTARDNFSSVIGLGNLSEESKNMLFHEFKSEMLSNRTRGTGYMLTNGSNLTEIQVPKITDMKKLESTIRKGVLR